MATHDNSLGAIIILKETFPEPVVIGGDPDGLLRVIGLEHVLTLHLHGDDQVRRWIWVRLAGLTKLNVAGHLGEELITGSNLCWSEKNKCFTLRN